MSTNFQNLANSDLEQCFFPFLRDAEQRNHNGSRFVGGFYCAELD